MADEASASSYDIFFHISCFTCTPSHEDTSSSSFFCLFNITARSLEYFHTASSYFYFPSLFSASLIFLYVSWLFTAMSFDYCFASSVFMIFFMFFFFRFFISSFLSSIYFTFLFISFSSSVSPASAADGAGFSAAPRCAIFWHFLLDCAAAGWWLRLFCATLAHDAARFATFGLPPRRADRAPRRAAWALAAREPAVIFPFIFRGQASASCARASASADMPTSFRCAFF